MSQTVIKTKGTASTLRTDDQLEKDTKLFSPHSDAAVRRVECSEAFYLNSPIIAICVGGEGHQQTFFVHQKVLTARSDFFNCATKEEWLGSDARRIAMPDDRPDIFRLYVNLLYKKEMATKGQGEWLNLCRLYTLADKLQDTTTRNRVVDAMSSLLTDCISTGLGGLFGGPVVKRGYQLSAESIEELYTHTLDGSPIRRFIVDYYVDHAVPEWLQKGKGSFPEEFLYDVAVSLLQKRPSQPAETPAIREAFKYYTIGR